MNIKKWCRECQEETNHYYDVEQEEYYCSECEKIERDYRKQDNQAKYE